MFRWILFFFVAYWLFRGFRRVMWLGLNQVGSRLQAKTAGQLDQFLASIFGMLAKMAKADGVISQNEVAVIESFMQSSLRLPPQVRQRAIYWFNQAKDDPQTFDDYARQYHQMVGRQPQLLYLGFEAVCAVAQADGPLHGKEQEYLNRLAELFGIRSAGAYSAGSGTTSNNAGAYAILESQSSDALETIRSRYRKLVRQYHPDVVIAKGLPEEFVVLANQKVQQFNAAFELIKQEKAGSR